MNHPVTGPIFSGPQQQPFVCKTQTQGLGFPQVDNQAASACASSRRRATRRRRRSAGARTARSTRSSTTSTGRPAASSAPLPPGPLPADVAMTTTLDGRTVPYVVRRERGTINRFIYAISILAPPGDPAAPPDTSLWNGRVIYAFDGGVAIGHNQGTLGGSHLYDPGLSKGYAILHSSGTRTSTHYNLVLGAETAIMTKERFIEGYGVPLYTVGVGGSGGAIQQYVYAQRHPGRDHRRGDPAVLVPGHGHADHPRRRLRAARALHGRHRRRQPEVGRLAEPHLARRPGRERDVAEPVPRARPGSTECVNGWRGLTPLALNPHFGTAGAGTEFYDPAVIAAVKWTHWDDLRNVYGVGPNGYARVPSDNVGVQYGLQRAERREGHARRVPQAERDGRELEGNERHGPGGLPVLPGPAARHPRSSTRGAAATCGSAPTAASRPRRGVRATWTAANAAYTSGIVFRGDIDIPIIDWRHYLEHRARHAQLAPVVRDAASGC